MKCSFDDRTNSTRSHIVKQMMAMVCDLGYRKVNMEDVAAAANVSRATVYSYFKDKEDLMMAVIKDLTLEDREILKEIIRGKGSVTERFFRFLTTRIQLKLDRCQATQLSLDDIFSLVRHRMIGIRAEVLKIDTGLLAELLIEGRLEGTFQVEDPVTTAESMILAMNCFMPFSLTIQELGDAETLSARMNAMIEMFFKSLAAPEFTPSKPAHRKSEPATKPFAIK